MALQIGADVGVDHGAGAPSRQIWTARPVEPYPPAPVVTMLDILAAVTRRYAS